MKNSTGKNYSPKQGRLPVFIADSLDICDPVLAFDEIMEEIGIERYLKPKRHNPLGRPGYSRVNMLKTILFSFMDTGYPRIKIIHRTKHRERFDPQGYGAPGI